MPKLKPRHETLKTTGICALVLAALPEEFAYQDANSFGDNLTSVSRSILDPGSDRTFTIVVNKMAPFKDAFSKKISLYFYGHINYTDIYKKKWRRDFCYVYEPWRPMAQRFVPYHEHNEEYRT